MYSSAHLSAQGILDCCPQMMQLAMIRSIPIANAVKLCAAWLLTCANEVNGKSRQKPAWKTGDPTCRQSLNRRHVISVATTPVSP
jgi:hypothetical protein